MTPIILALLIGAFQMPELSLPAIGGASSEELLANLPHTKALTEPIVMRGEEPRWEDAIVRAGGYYRYALDLYQLDKTYYAERIKANLEALALELVNIGDQGQIKAQKRVDEAQALAGAIEQQVAEDSVLAMFRHLDTEIRTLVGEYRPNGVHAYDLGNWITAMGVRVTFYPGCLDEVCKSLVLSNVNLLIEKVEWDDSDHWNKVLVALPEDAVYIADRIKTIEFLSGLPYYPIITHETIDELLLKLHVVYKVFNLEFVA
jgi:hypothetical protein